jgi:hypothetical protein
MIGAFGFIEDDAANTRNIPAYAIAAIQGTAADRIGLLQGPLDMLILPAVWPRPWTRDRQARMLRTHPLFTLTAVLSLALGIGANTAIFTLLHVSLWKPLPVKEPHQIFHVVKQPGRRIRLLLPAAPRAQRRGGLVR